MSRLLAVNPGKRSIGWAVFARGSLIHCGVTSSRNAGDLAQVFGLGISRYAPINEIIVEVPQIHSDRPMRKSDDLNDMIREALCAGIAIACVEVGETTLIMPQDWRGRQDRRTINRFIAEVLDDRELCLLDESDVPPSLRHNVIDAIGIGLWRLGR